MVIKITICMGSSCFARGNDKNLKVLEDYILKNNLSEVVKLYGSGCENECASGPFIKIAGKKIRCPDSGTLIDILNTELTGLLTK